MDLNQVYVIGEVGIELELKKAGINYIGGPVRHAVFSNFCCGFVGSVNINVNYIISIFFVLMM